MNLQYSYAALKIFKIIFELKNLKQWMTQPISVNISFD